MNHEDSLQTLNDLLRCCGTHDLNFVLSAEVVNTTNMESLDGKGPNKSRAKSCHGPCGKGVDLIGSGWAVLLTSWYPKHVMRNLSVPLSIPDHHTFDHNLFIRLTIPGCPSCASVRTRGLSLLGITILVPRRISLPITHRSLASDMYCLRWPSRSLYGDAAHWILHLLLTLLQARVLSSRGVAVTTNLTN